MELFILVISDDPNRQNEIIEELEAVHLEVKITTGPYDLVGRITCDDHKESVHLFHSLRERLSHQASLTALFEFEAQA